MTQNVLSGSSEVDDDNDRSEEGRQRQDWMTDHPKTDNHHWRQARQPDLPVGTAGRLWLESNCWFPGPVVDPP